MILNECIEEGRKGDEELTHEPMMVGAVAGFIMMLMGERERIGFMVRRRIKVPH